MEKKGEQIKRIYESLRTIISNLDVIGQTLNSLRKGIETTRPALAVSDYYKLLLASERIKDTIEILGGMLRGQKNNFGDLNYFLNSS